MNVKTFINFLFMWGGGLYTYKTIYSNIMLDDTKDPITFPVIAALLLGAAKVLQQQSLMIYCESLSRYLLYHDY